ncbi:piriformospora indica-insensitive protein 2-like [Salvia divinorum]|uniref:Piriformospora indica-insensitive protein 2-like n=1 Tax=Salvia divinorum TaxID=28513 RepID=A0ABD1GU83_SALDI
MAQWRLSLTIFSILAAAATFTAQSPLNPAEQEAVYRILDSVSPGTPWRSIFPDDLCSSAPHGVACDYFSSAATPHVTELSFGYVSDYTPNPACNPNSTLNPSLLAPLPRLRKLMFYKCFAQTQTPFPDFSSLSHASSLEELIFIENPALIGTLDGRIGNLKRLRRLILIGTGVSGGVTDWIGDLEQLTLSRNGFSGEIPMNAFRYTTKLKILDLSYNAFEGSLPESIGFATSLIKVDLSHNKFSGKIPENLTCLKNVQFLDLSYNNFGRFGFPLSLAEMTNLKEVYLSGNSLGGEIPDIWENMRGIMGIGLSSMGLVGTIPKSMGVHLRNACYIGLDNNMLQGVVPHELGDLEFVSELNLENNNLSGMIPFSADFLSKLGGKLKLEGNLDLCIDETLKSAKVSLDLGHIKVCRKPYVSKNVLFHESFSASPSFPFLALVLGVLALIVVSM